MKKILKYYLPTLILLSAIGILFLGYMLKNHIVVLKYLAGEAKIIKTQTSATVRENGIEQKRIKLFEDEGKIYIVFQETEDLGFGVLIVDEKRKDIFAPNVGNCYELLFSSYLFQAETGCGGDYYSGLKHEMYNVKLESTNSNINFQLPEYNYGKVERDRKMEIIFRGE